MNHTPKQLTYLMLSMSSALLLWGCPADPESNTEPVEPQITVSSALPCVEPILPVFKSDEEESPTIGTIEVAVTGISAGESNGLEVKLFYEDERVVGCFLSSVSAEAGVANYRCNTLESSALSLSARRAYDSLYCLNRGKMEVYAEVTLPDGTYKRSEPHEVVCIDQDTFASSCTPVGVPAPQDMDVDLGDSDMGLDMEPIDMEPRNIPTQWSVSYSSPESPTLLSSQGSVSEAPNVGRYQFRVVDQNGEGLAGVPVRFFLNWSAVDDYPVCSLRCHQELSATACDERDACVWDLSTPPAVEPEGGSVGGLEGGAEGGVSAATEGGAPRPPQPVVGSCRVRSDWEGEDERCENSRDTCEANYCLPTRNNAIGKLPVAIDPYYAVTSADGTVSVSMVAQNEPGVFSVRAEVTIDHSTQVANTPNVTILHEIATQSSLSFSCSPNVLNTFSTRSAPTSANLSGYQLYQFADPISTCSALLGDRYSGPIRGSSVFFLSESGVITQSAITDEFGRATSSLQGSQPAPEDVDPRSFPSPFIDIPNPATERGDRQCQPEESLTGTCEDIEEPVRSLFWGAGDINLNPRDGLTKVIAFTQGEVTFIDRITVANDPIQSAVGHYQPEYDFVPLHPEPFVDSNDNQRWDEGERFFDANRNGSWDIDVFGRVDFLPNEPGYDERVEEYRCAHTNLLIEYAATSQGTSPVYTDCLRPSTVSNYILDKGLLNDNPQTLNAYIWTSTQLLNVGLPSQSPDLTPVKLTCRNDGSDPESDQTDRCSFNPLFINCEGETPPPAHIYLDATSGDAPFYMRVHYTDDNLNCLGLTDVSYTVSGAGLEEASPSLNSPFKESALGWGGYSPNYEHCISPILDTPLAKTLITGAVATRVTPDPNGPSKGWVSSGLELVVTVPDHRVTTGGALTLTHRVSVAVCHNQ